MFEVTTHETTRGEEQGTAWSVCTNPACFAEREVPAVKTTINRLGVSGAWKRIPIESTSYLEARKVEDGKQVTDDSVYECSECGGPAILSENRRREVPTQGYAHPMTAAWRAQREARGA